MSQQIQITGGAKVRNLEGVLTGTSGVVNALGINVPSGIPQLDGSGKILVSQLPNSVMEYKGTWNAATNTPTLANGTGNAGDVYLCNVAGTVNFGAGPITFAVGDQVLYSGTTWERASGATGTVTSVAVTESGDALSITGSPITTNGTINIGFAGTGAQYIKGDGTLATFPTTIDQAKRLITEVYNSTGATLAKGSVVYINGGQGNLPTVTKAIATGDATSAQTYGVVQSDITNMNNGFVVVLGSLNDLDTQAYSVGTQLYLSGTTAGEWTSTKPYAPIHLVYVGIVVRSHPTQGVVEVRIQNGYELDELHDVSAQSPTNGDILQYVSATDLWTKTAGTTTNIAEGTRLYYTDARSRAALSFAAGSGAYNSTTGVITIPTNTNQLTNGASFITLASLSAGTGISYNNSTGVISSTITQYTDALARAALSFTAGSGGYNSTTGVITIPTNNNQITNGSNFITLASLSAGAGISYNNTTGAISSTITQYTDALARAAISLTTTGSSGAATYNSTTGVFNIPNYGSALSGYVPYTGATGAVNLGANNLTAQIGFFTSGQTFFANISTDVNGGYIQAYRASDNTYHPFRIFAGSGTTAIKSFILNNTGATLDVALNGTSANFTSSVNGLNYTMGNWNTINYTASIMQIGGISASQWQQIDFYTAGNLRATINSEGVTNFFRSVTTTSFFQTIGSGTYLRAGGYIWAGGSGGDYGSVGYNIGYNSATSGSYTYVVNDLASMVRFENGGFNFLTAPTGAIGDAITFTPRVRFLNNGNILIGSNSDAGTKLYVNGTGRFDGNLSVQGALTANTGTGAIFRAVYAADGVVEIGNYGSLGYRQLDIVGSVINLGTGTAGGGSFTNRLTISALGVSTFSNTVIVNGQLSSNSLVVRNFSGLNDVAFIGSRSDWTSGPANLEMAIGSYRPSITFFTNNSTTERMRLTAVGRLGLGTDNPTSLLHIYGADPFLRIGNTSAGDQGIKITYLNDDTSSLNLLYNPNVATAWIENTYVQTAGQPWGDIHIRQNVGGTMTTRMLFKNIANSIYIGTTTGVSGGGALQVNGNVNINGVFQINGTTIGGGGGSGVTGSGTTNYVSKWTGASTLGNSLIFDTGSYVSMNTTTNPNLGGFTNTTLLLRQVADGATGGGLQIQANGSDNVAFFGFTGSFFRIGTSYRSTGSYQPIVLQTSGSDNLRIENSGNILINTATDNGYKLQINGSASFAFGFLSIFRGSTGANDIFVGNQGTRFYIGGNTYVEGSVTALGGFFDTSDSRLKILVKDYEQPKGIENVAARMYVKNSRKELGYFAQDLQEILPSAVSEGSDGFLTLSYSQVHTAKIAHLEAEVAELKELIKSLIK
jgi:hypothetical protein